MIRRCTGALSLVLLLATTEATAFGDPRVQLVLGACDAVRLDDVRARLAIELPGSMQLASRPFAQTMVRIDCTAATTQLTVDDPLTAKGLTRTIDLRGGDTDVRSRTVAIAIAELVAASWSELETNPSPRVPAAATPPSGVVDDALAATRHAHRSRVGRLQISAVASTQVFFSSAGVLWGGGLRVAADASRYVGWSVDLLEHHGGFDDALGHVSIDTLTASGSALAHRHWRHVGLGGGLGFRIGATILRGRAAEGTRAGEGTVTWAAGGPLATLHLRVFPVHGLVLELATEGGYWLFPTGGLVNRRRDVAVDGPWVGVQLGIGIVL